MDNRYKVKLFSLILIIFSCLPVDIRCLCNDTLVLTHVIFRHGDRTPSKGGLWKSNEYYNETFYAPYGYGQLTNQGKLKAFQLGQLLRQRYNRLLGTTWSTKVCESWTTDYDRTKMSLSLVLGGLFPPDKAVRWNKEILWQAIPYSYLPVEQDKELSSWACPTVVPLIYSIPDNMKKLKSYDQMLETLNNNTGEDFDYISALDVYFGLKTQEEMGFPLDHWTKAVYPEPLRTYIVDFYFIETSTKELKRILIGYILKKIISDTIKKIDGTLEPLERKMFLYSGHEVNVGTMLAALKYNLTEVPPYGAHVTFEVHKIQGIYGIKMFYDDLLEKREFALDGCETFCSINDFVRLTTDIMPQGDQECYGTQ
ncbi:venom acid phosphatase Acph-1-like [Anthonomus grandis grandis]|uniref:venom acid phosphatase Acph-1-like n=1 Tax=Anthonomus grandis grandis TaxID=2921223 RepID=UPI002165C2E5|nr:venom acid phosphatase Acph-1-like [Anthonomus grandis grandis]